MHIIGCILYVQRVVHALNDRFPYLSVYNATKLFSPHNYPSDRNDWITNTKLWLERILLKFQYTEEVSDMCKGELLELTNTFQHECENKTIFEAWHICGSKWHTNWPKLMKLWQKVILIPSSIAICEEFPNKMQSKATSTIGWTWRPLMLLCRSSLCGLEVDAMDWATIVNIWTNMQDQRILTLDWWFFVTNQDCILIIQNTSFSKILCNPKLRWRFRIRCTCQLTFFLSFENITWHFRFEVERQMKFVKHTHWLQQTFNSSYDGISYQYFTIFDQIES